MDLTYQLIGDSNVTTKSRRKHRRLRKNIKKIVLITVVILVAVATVVFFYPSSSSSYDQKILIKGESRIDKYGIELNKYILDGIYSTGFDGDIHKRLEDSKLYVPPCPNIQTVYYPDAIRNPKCDESSLQFDNLYFEHGKGLPYSLSLNNITLQLENWEKWEKKHKAGESPYYANQRFYDMVNEDYHPFDYGYKGPDTSAMSDEEYYRHVIHSRMDEVPDPRRRRLFFFILFNTEFNLLDLQLAEFYDVVDYFVIYEANSTFSGFPKPLYFTRALLETNRYDRYKDKIIPLPLPIEVNDDSEQGKAFPRERVARRVLIEKGLRAVQARHGDIYIQGDLDEFPKPYVLYRMKKCGGWEHLQMGIGGGPRSFQDTDVQSYLVDEETQKAMGVTVDNRGSYEVDYYRSYSMGFMTWFFEYAFHIIKDDQLPGVTRPNLAIFDARLSLGQLPERYNNPKLDPNTSSASNQRAKMKREHKDLLVDPSFDPYQGYTYTNNTNYQFNGKGFIGENIRLSIGSFYENVKNNDTALLWNGGWHLSTFLPNIDIIYNKVASYSHSDHYDQMTEEEAKEVLRYRVKHHSFIHGKFDSFKDYDIAFPTSYYDGYSYEFDKIYWKDNINTNGTDKAFQSYVHTITHDLPLYVWKNPICYNYMIDRDYGVDKKLWWEYVPRSQWNTTQFGDLEPAILEELLPVNITGNFRSEYLNSLKKNGF